MKNLLLFFLVCTADLNGQDLSKISIDNQRQDLEILRKTIEQLHPDPYRYTNKETFNSKFDSAYSAIQNELTEIEFYRIIAPLITQIKNGHTFISLPDSYYNGIALLPLKLVTFQERIYVHRDLSDKMNEIGGFELLKINNVPVNEIMAKIIPYVQSDGFNDNARYKAAVEDDLAYYYSQVFGDSESYEVVLKNQKTQTLVIKTMQGISNAQFIARYPHNTSFPWSLQKIDTLNAALLKIGSLDNFALSDNKRIFFKNFLEDSFNEIKKWKVENLILDLRNNGGGELKNSILLYSYLTNGPFQFSKEIEIASITPPTYIQYTNYDKAIKFNPIKFKSVVKKDETVFYLNEHFSMIKTQPANSSFKGNLFVMIRNTASSAGCLAAYIHSNKRGTIIGEENRDNYTGYSAGVPVVLTLPHSKIRINIPLRKFTYVTGKDTGRGTIPDLPVSMSCEDFFNGHDTDIAHILKLLDSRQ
jgi:hypothetical protein